MACGAVPMAAAAAPPPLHPRRHRTSPNHFGASSMQAAMDQEDCEA
jgi:hypothetical protein